MEVQIILVTIIWLEMLPTPTTLAETEKQQKLFHTVAADPRNTHCRDDSPFNEEIQPFTSEQLFHC